MDEIRLLFLRLNRLIIIYLSINRQLLIFSELRKKTCQKGKTGLYGIVGSIPEKPSDAMTAIVASMGF
jgi:hypothetical protein